MSGGGIVSLVIRLAAADPAACDRAGLAEIVKDCAAMRSWVDALEARVAIAARRLDEPVAPLLTAGGRRSNREAEAAGRRAGVCETLPGVHDALAAGAVSGEHVDALARLVADVGDEGRSELVELAPSLITAASSSSVEEFRRELTKLTAVLTRDHGVGVFEQQRRQRCLKRWVDKVTGMCHTLLVLDPLTDAKVDTALRAAVARECAKPGDGRTLDQIKADAMVELITRKPGETAAQPGVPEVVVLVDEQSMRDGPHDHTVAETSHGQPVPVEVIRRLHCEGTTVEVTVNRSGEVLNVGRAKRVATRAQRTALRAMYRTCGHPDCQVGFADCDIHHVLPWERGGPTDLPNLLPLCSKHHHLVHEGGWTLTLRGDRTITLTTRDGTTWFEGSTVDAAPDGVDDGIDDLIRARAQALAPPGQAA